MIPIVATAVGGISTACPFRLRRLIGPSIPAGRLSRSRGSRPPVHLVRNPERCGTRLDLHPGYALNTPPWWTAGN